MFINYILYQHLNFDLILAERPAAALQVVYVLKHESWSETDEGWLHHSLSSSLSGKMQKHARGMADGACMYYT
jgi:hypothetical protein